MAAGGPVHTVRSVEPPRHGKGEDRFVAEDIHMAIENRLIKRLGETGGRLHTARSRNDQVALDERLYLQKAIAAHDREDKKPAARARDACAAATRTVLMPGYTHLQRAQPVLFAHHLLAYVEMLDRDYERFIDGLRRAAKISSRIRRSCRHVLFH